MSDTELAKVKTEPSQNGEKVIEVENEDRASFVETHKENAEKRIEVRKSSKIDAKTAVGRANNICGFFKEDKLPKFWVQFSYGRGSGKGDGFYDPSRNSFVKLVLSIVLVMLIITAIFTMVVYEIDDLRAMFLRNAVYLLIPSGIVLVLISFALPCSACARAPPCNYIILIITLIAMSIICATITARYRTQLVAYALIATALTVVICILMACSSMDFTKYMIYVVAVGAAFAAISTVIGVAMLITKTQIPILRLVMLVVGTLIQVVVLILELQLILGGKTVQLDEGEYILAATMVYTSVVQLFLDLLKMFGTIDELLD